MKPWEQRVTNWGAVLLGIASVLLLLRLERDRFQNPFAAPIGVKWEKARVIGGVNTVPVQYTDAITLTNLTDGELENVEIVVENWNSGTEVVSKVGKLAPKKERKIELIDVTNGFPVYPYEIDPRDVLVVRCPGYANKRIPVKELGKDKSLRDSEKEENKENNADKDFWKKFWKWERDLRKQGIEPTEEMFDKWLEERERERKGSKKTNDQP